MRPIIRYVSAAALLGVCLSGTLSAGTSDYLTDFDGRPAGIERYAGNGKWLVVMIWASDCHVCNQEVEHYEAFHEAHQQRDARVLGISMDGLDNVEAARNFIKRHKVRFANLIGSPQDVTRLYGELTGEYLPGTPTFLIYDPKGKLVAKQAGAVPVKLIEDFIRKSS